MNLEQQVQQHAGAVGAAVTASSGVAGFVASAIPVLQACSLLVAIVVGILTAIWYWKRLRGGKSGD